MIVRPLFCFGLCIAVIAFPIRIVLAWIVAAFIHELGHLVALKVLHIPVGKITLDLNGAMIESGYMSAISELVCALAGPIAGMLCLLGSTIVPYVALFGFLQSIYNLLPFPDYDGGRALNAVLHMLMPVNWAEKIYSMSVLVLTFALLFLGLYLWFGLDIGIASFLFCIIPPLKSGVVKIPCKGSKQIVQ